jgi:hypothetical protein
VPGAAQLIMSDSDPSVHDRSVRRDDHPRIGTHDAGAVPLAAGDATDAPAIVGALWRLAPPGAPDADHQHLRRTLAAHLEDVAESARRLDADGGSDAARGLRLLADTADVLRAALVHPHADRWQLPPTPELPWPARLRLARLERWLAARATHEPGAMAAADLCLWLAEHLEAAQR